MRRKPLYILLGASVALAALAAHALFDLGGPGTDTFFNSGVYDALILVSALLCVARAVKIREERAAWAVLGVGLLSSFAGELYWSLNLDNTPPFPSPADAAYLGFYPAAYVALMLLARSRVREFQRSVWFDGLIAGLTLAAVGATFILQPVIDATGGSVAAVATTLAYPLGDIILLAFVLLLLMLTGWRRGPLMLLAAGFAVSAVADSIYVVQAAKETYTEGTILDSLWPLGTLLMATAAWLPAGKPAARARLDGWRMMVVPGVSAGVVLGMNVLDGSMDIGPTARILTYAALFAILMRACLTYSENLRLLATSREEATSDALTGLGNRRQLMADLPDDMRASEQGEARLLLLFDLDGFKQYNDTFGHPAGDALLARLGHQLNEAMAPFGTAYRMGGDEFCVIVREAAQPDDVADIAAAALHEAGEGFEVSSSFGVVQLGVDAADAAAALQLADQRMYAQKDQRRASARRQTRDVLLKSLHERQPLLQEHSRVVVDRAVTVGREMGLEPEDLDVLTRAGELHDIGKIAIPDAILDKPGPLDADELAFMRRHPAIGDRILSAAPALRPVARVVRSSHEHFDGSGYPDGLRGDKIPLGARILAVCDAYAAMTSERPWRAPMSDEDAVARLQREAGTRFDPAVVTAFAAALNTAPVRNTVRAGEPSDPLPSEAVPPAAS